MQMGFRFAASFAVVMVAGCAVGTTTPKYSTVVTVSAYGPDIFGQHEHGVGGQWDVRESSGEATPLSYPPMDLRACNQSMTECALGFGVIKGTAQIISQNATSATVALNLTYQVGRSYSYDDNGQQFKREVPADVQALQANQVIAKRVEVAYGEVVHLPLPYGVDVALCAQKHRAGELMLDRSVCNGY